MTGRNPTYEELEQRVEKLEREAVAHNQANELYRAQVEKSIQGLIIIQNLSIVFTNNAFAELSGYTVEELLSLSPEHVTALIYPEDQALVWGRLQDRLEGKAVPARYEFRGSRKDGEIRWLEMIASQIEYNGAPAIQGAFIDISERKWAEEKLRSQKMHLESLINYSSLAIVELDDKFNILSCNGYFEDLFQFKEFEIIGKNLDYVIAKEHYLTDAVSYTKKTLGGEPIHGSGKRYRKDGARIDVEFVGVPVRIEGNVVGAYGVYLDISERKQMEEALLAEKERFQSLSENAPFGMVMIAKDGTFTHMNPKFYELFGYYLGDIPNGRTWFQKAYPDSDYRHKAISAWIEDLASSESGEKRPRVFKVQCKDGSKKIINFIPVQLETGENLMACEDITDIKRAEEALKESEEKYRLLVENASDAIFIAQDEVIKFPNPKTEEMIGYTKEELATVPFDDLIHPEDRTMVLEMHRKRLQREKVPSSYSFRLRRKSGDEIWVNLNTVVTIWEGRPAILNFLRDTTEQRRLESQLHHAQRMEALGTLASGIAHDFNNLLMGIQGNASLMLLDKDTANPDYGGLKNIERYVQDGADLTKQLLGFARGGRYNVKPTDLNTIVRRSSDMFGKTKKEITIRTNYQQDIWASDVDQAQIEQVLLNLYVNAWQAMPAGGELYLETQNVTLDEDYVKPFNMSPGRFVKIAITDTGVGMDKKTRQRIFEPFFTTKEMGRGTGLGLASVHGIIKNHAGIINVYSEKGEGTTFTMYLPATEKKPMEGKELSEEIQKGRETILLVDDEDMILTVGRKLLKSLGYTVITARSGKEAIETLKTNLQSSPPDLVILDMIMPHMGGGETYDRIKEIHPAIKVLLSSGYSINGQAEEILKRGCNGFIQKPFTMRELSQSIREIVEKE